MAAGFDQALLARIEDASVHASAPPQEQGLDGWRIRTCPGAAQRARSIQAVTSGSLPLPDKLAQASELYGRAGLPLLIRLTPFSRPAELDVALAQLGWSRHGQTHVLVRRTDFRRLTPKGLPPGCVWEALPGAAFAAAVGALRGSSPEQQRAHAERLVGSKVPYSGFVIRQQQDGRVLCCGQFAREGSLVGLYDIHTASNERGRGLAGTLCERLLRESGSLGAETAYLQVAVENAAALAVYRRLGFEPGYDYHYRQAPPKV